MIRGERMSYFILMVILSLGSDLGAFTDKQCISLTIAGFILWIADSFRGK